MKFPKKAVVALVACSAVVFAGCSSSGSSTSESVNASSENAHFLSASYDELTDGGELKLAIGELTEQQNTFHQDGTAYTSTFWSWYNPDNLYVDENLEYHRDPNYVESVTEDTVDGNTVLTFKLNDKAKFNDGTPIDYTAYQTLWKIQNGQNPEDYPASSTDGYKSVSSVERGDDDFTVVITFDGIYPWWDSLFSTPVHPALADPTVYKTGYLKQLHNEWGAGPYMVETADFNQNYATFVPNPNWWGPKPKLERITYRQMEAQATINAFKNGEIDAAGVATRDNLAAIDGMTGIQLTKGLRTANNLYMLNSESPILADLEVRKAIFTAIDLTQLEKIRYDGMDYDAPTSGSFIYYQGQPEYQNNFAKAVSYSTEDAKAILEEAGWTLGSDGIYEKDGQRLSLTYPLIGDSAVVKSTTLATQKMLKDAGIELNIENRPSSEFSAVYTKKEFDMFGLGFTSSALSGVPFFGQIYASDSTLNLSGTGTPEFDEKIAELEALPTKEEQIARAQELEVEAFKLYGIMPSPVPPEITATKAGLANYGATGLQGFPNYMIGWTDKRMEES
ncbi:MAG: ABC transporter family substrate-binding protein [Corynebacterium sp.]|nr:ABC transporter family substrate-binding protein [Corynebacterium sp.]